MAKRVVLLNNTMLRNQLASLERYVTGTHEGVRHPQVASAHDDVATAACGALVTASSLFRYTLEPFSPDFVDRDAPQAQQQQQPVSCADQRLNDLYRNLDFGFRFGLIRGL